jgi:hypothetical protein
LYPEYPGVACEQYKAKRDVGVVTPLPILGIFDGHIGALCAERPRSGAI